MNKYWGIFRDGKLVTSGRVNQYSGNDPVKLRDTYYKGCEIRYSENSFAKPQVVGGLFGMTWEQIREWQQKR